MEIAQSNFYLYKLVQNSQKKSRQKAVVTDLMGHGQMKKTGQLSSTFGITPRIHYELKGRTKNLYFWNDACNTLTLHLLTW